MRAQQRIVTVALGAVLALCGTAAGVVGQNRTAEAVHPREVRSQYTDRSAPAAEAEIHVPAALEPDPGSRYLFDTPKTANLQEPGPVTPAPEAEVHVPAALEFDTAGSPEPSPPDPVITALVAKLNSVAEPRYRGSKDDLAAIKAFYTAGEPRLLWTGKNGFTRPARLVIKEIRQADDWGLQSAAFVVPKLSDGSHRAVELADAEIKLAMAVLKYARHARGGRLNPRSVSRLFDQKPEILEPISVLLLIEKSKDAAQFLRELHPQHPQFNRLRLALTEARKASAQAATGAAGNGGKSKSRKGSRASIRRIIANMERWRWMPRNLGPFYVWDDVPEQTTSVIKNGRRVLKEKMVVGKPSTPTPMFSSEMKYIIFHPSWGVPPGMKKNELGPQLRKTGGGGWFSNKPLASSVLKSHGLNVTRGGRRINPDSVDWSTANVSSYHFTQPPGPKNVLGIVKFRFPNKHNVYMHDTPERHLFKGRKRTFSHGCMRVQNPVRLAEVLLEHDKGWGPKEVARHKRRGTSISLTNPIPVHIAYFTVHVDDTGKAQVRSDIYGVDSRVASALARRRVHVGSVATGGKRNAKPRRSYRKKKKRRRARVKKKEAWNPFESMHENGG